MSAKISEVKVVGFERPGMQFPEKPDGFFDFLRKKIVDRFRTHPITPKLLDSVKIEAIQLLDLANDIYGLGCDRNFWHIDVLVSGPEITLVYRPSSISLLYDSIECEPYPGGGWVAKVGKHFVRGDSELEALVGLGRLMKARNSSPPPRPHG